MEWLLCGLLGSLLSSILGIRLLGSLLSSLLGSRLLGSRLLGSRLLCSLLDTRLLIASGSLGEFLVRGLDCFQTSAFCHFRADVRIGQ